MVTGLESLKISGDWPLEVGCYEGELLIVAGGRCLWDDLNILGAKDCDVMAVNDIGMRFPGRITHWYSNHAEQLPHWSGIRAMGHSGRTWGPELTHAMVEFPHAQKADCVWPLKGRGNSGLSAILVGLALGYAKIWVCGVPMDNSGHTYDPPDGHWLQTEARGYGGKKVLWSNFRSEGYDKIIENDARRVYQGRVTFLSGRGAEILKQRAA